MPNIFELVVYGTPVAQARVVPKPIYKNGVPLIKNNRPVIVSYLPTATKKWRAIITAEAQRIVRETGFQMFPKGEALAMSLVFIFDRPQSVTVKKRPHHTVKPDLDNITKNIKDGLSGVVYADDQQVSDYFEPYGKRYAREGEQPCVRIQIIHKEDLEEMRNATITV